MSLTTQERDSLVASNQALQEAILSIPVSDVDVAALQVELAEAKALNVVLLARVDVLETRISGALAELQGL